MSSANNANRQPVFRPVDRCNLCNGTEFAEKYRIRENASFSPLWPDSGDIAREGIRIVKCRNCGLVFTDPRRPAEEISKIYADEYHRAHKEELKLNAYEERLRRIREYKGSGDLLDIGCGYGYFLKAASRYFSVTGLEASKDAVKFVKDVQKVPAINERFLSADLREGSFDIVTLWDTIEHLYDPYSNLVKINKILKRGGVLALRTGDIASLNAGIAGRHWFFYHLIDHAYFFSRKTMTGLLDKAGFDVLRVYHEEAGFRNIRQWIKGMVKSMIKIALSLFNRGFGSETLGNYLKTKGEPVVPMLADQMVLIARKTERHE